MNIRPSADIRNNYRKIADYCIETGEPVFLTNNGQGELVVMSIQAWQDGRLRTRTGDDRLNFGTIRKDLIENIK